MRSTCALALAHCQSVAMPSAPSLSLDTPLSASELSAVAKEMMKVHTITLATSGIAMTGGGETAFASSNGMALATSALKDQSSSELLLSEHSFHVTFF